jgi:hypothetical protein
MSSCSRGTSHASLRPLRRRSSGLGSKSLVHGGGRSLDEDPLFLFCVFCFAEPTMESDRWPVVVEGRETDRWRRRSSRLRVWSVAMGGIFNEIILQQIIYLEFS